MMWPSSCQLFWLIYQTLYKGLKGCCQALKVFWQPYVLKCVVKIVNTRQQGNHNKNVIASIQVILMQAFHKFHPFTLFHYEAFIEQYNPSNKHYTGHCPKSNRYKVSTNVCCVPHNIV